MKKRLAAFGFRSIPPRAGCAGADKFAEELLTRLVKKGFEVTAYNRVYDNDTASSGDYHGIHIVDLKTNSAKGFDTLLHSFKATWHIIRHDTGDIVHIQNGGNSIWAVFLRLFGKKVFISQDGVDWKRGKWPWYGKAYLYLSAHITAKAPNAVIFDNIFAKELFESKFHKKFDFIPFGSEVSDANVDDSVLEKWGLIPGEYFLFVGRFIPDKGLQYLVPAFEQVETDKKLVLVGGSPNPSGYEAQIKSTTDARIIFPGFVYGSDVHALMKNAYAYIQPSDIEGLSPVILENMWLQTPIICSDIKENIYVVGDTALTFKKGDSNALRRAIDYSIANPEALRTNAKRAKKRADEKFSWDTVADQHIDIFLKGCGAVSQ